MNKLSYLELTNENIQFIDGHILYKVKASYAHTGHSYFTKHTMYMTLEGYNDLVAASGLKIQTGEYKETKPMFSPRVHHFVPFEPVG